MMQPTSIIVQLVHIHGPLKGDIQEFSKNEIAIGRHASCDLQFPRDLVVISRKHAHIIREGNRFKIIDNSTNGTFVNGKRISETYLKNGDVIFFTEGGPKVSFLTRVGAPMEAEPQQPQSPQGVDVASETSAQPTAQPEPQPLVQPRPVAQAPPQPAVQPQEIVQPEPQPAVPPQPVSRPAIQIETVKVPLIIQYGPVLQSFTELPVTIGSKGDCDLVLEHPALLERHVQIFFSQGSYRIKDLTGRNQVMVNDQPITPLAAITPGDKIFLTPTGPAFHFMEGGRMAEIVIPQQEPPETVDDMAPRKKEMPSGKKKGSLFKKFFS